MPGPSTIATTQLARLIGTPDSSLIRHDAAMGADLQTLAGRRGDAGE